MFKQIKEYKIEGGIKIGKYQKKAHPIDISFKRFSQKKLAVLLSILMINVEIDEILSTNFINQKYDRIRLDFAFSSKNGYIYDLEFESKTPGFKEHLRYVLYMICLFGKYKKPVKLFVILANNAKIPEKPIIAPFVKKEYIQYICLKDIDGDEVLNIIKNKHKNNEKLTEYDLGLLSLIPCFSTKKRYEDYLIKAAYLIMELNENPEDIDDICISFILFAQLAIDTETQDKIRGIFTMKLGAIERYGIEREIEGEKKGKKIGEKKGEKKEKLKIAKNLIDMQLPISQIEKATGLSELEIKSL